MLEKHQVCQNCMNKINSLKITGSNHQLQRNGASWNNSNEDRDKYDTSSESARKYHRNYSEESSEKSNELAKKEVKIKKSSSARSRSLKRNSEVSKMFNFADYGNSRNHMLSSLKNNLSESKYYKKKAGNKKSSKKEINGKSRNKYESDSSQYSSEERSNYKNDRQRVLALPNDYSNASYNSASSEENEGSEYGSSDLYQDKVMKKHLSLEPGKPSARYSENLKSGLKRSRSLTRSKRRY
ncbi:MAG: hypothetical protein MHPSP_000150 [Paramarteilia canceri]